MTRLEQIEAARPKDLNMRCDDVHCCASKVWGEAAKWADENPIPISSVKYELERERKIDTLKQVVALYEKYINENGRCGILYYHDDNGNLITEHTDNCTKCTTLAAGQKLKGERE